MNKADVPPHIGPARVAVSFLRLFLGGLLPSRARFRFAGAMLINLLSTPPQSRGGQSVSGFPCLTTGVQSNTDSPKYNVGAGRDNLRRSVPRTVNSLRQFHHSGFRYWSAPQK